MEIKDRIIKTFSTIFNIDEKDIKLTDTKDDIEAWDSIGHLQLIMTIESEFGVKLTTEDVVQIDSIEKCSDIVEKSLEK